MRVENLSEIPIVITEARLSVGDARAMTAGGVGPDGNRVQLTYRGADARNAEFLINLVNQGNRRITEVAIDIRNELFWAERNLVFMTGPKAEADTAAGAQGAIDPQGSFAFKTNLQLEEKEGDRDLMSHLYDFTVRVIGVKFDSEKDWVWAASANTKRLGKTRIMKMRVASNPKNEEGRNLSPIEQRQKASDQILTMDRSTRPTILYREKAKYTEVARNNKIEGIVVLSVVFGVDAQLKDIEVVQGLPDGLTENAIEAAKKIRFEPAMKDGQPVSVRGKLEFSFNLYNNPILQMDASLRPTIIYREKAQYTKEARDNKVEGTVVLSVVFGPDGQISDIKVIRGLPYGLTEKAIEAGRKMRYEPAMKDGQPVSVRGDLEFSFSLY